jgi:hypothetical protein
MTRKKFNIKSEKLIIDGGKGKARKQEIRDKLRQE